MTNGRSQLLGLGCVLTMAFASACGCQPPPVTDGGQPDGGTDGGGPVPDGGGSTPDAGQDAGPPPELKILKVLPPRGGSAGGAQVLITGSGFIRDFATRGTDAKKDTTLKFGLNPTIDYQIIDDETIEARVPPGNAGLTNVTLTNKNGLFVCSGCFSYYDELYLGALNPKEGPLRGGNEVTIDGAGFTSDVEVLFGQISSPQVTFVSSKQLKVIVPRGAVADSVDLTVYNKNGVGSQRRVYKYFEDLRVASIAPLTGPIAGGTSVVITGKGFPGLVKVTFGGKDATSFTVDSPTQVTAVTPSGTSLGSVELALATGRDSWTVKNGFTYVDAAGPFALYGVFPHVGAAAGGNQVTVTGQGLNPGSLTVSFGGQSAAIVSQTATTAVVTVPARGAAARKVNVTATAGAGNGALPGGYSYRLAVSAIAPTVGPSGGGTAAVVSGAHLPADVQVFLGALMAGSGGAASETSAPVVTPKGSGGAPSDLWAREATDPENEALLAAAFTFNEPLAIGRVQPDRGAIAGGTLVTVLGAGFGESTVVKFGANNAKDVKIVDSHTLTCRTPKGEVGSVDVGVERLGPTDNLGGGFSYYDPRSISGGLSGGPLVGTLNITVLDSTQGFFGLPIPLANVLLGNDGATPFQGLTDARGQLTFSDPSLVKAQTVTVFKEGFETTTVTAVSSENLTVFVARTGGEGEPAPPPPGPPPSLISGRVTGFKAPRPLGPNESLEARVFLAQLGLTGGPPFQAPPSKLNEKWIVVTDDGEYLVFTRAGLRATYAVLGVKNKQTGSFEPSLMGVRRGITTSPDSPAVNQDIVLDMHLDLTVPVTIDSPISIRDFAGAPAVPAMNSVYAWLDLGAEGFIPNPRNWNTGQASITSVSGTQGSLSFPNFPLLDGSNFIFLNYAATLTSQSQSLFYRRQPGDMATGVTIGPMLPAPVFTAPTFSGFTGTISWSVDPGPAPNIHQLLVLKPTPFGNITLWSVVLPGSETQVALPAPAVQKLHDEESNSTLFVVLLSSRSPKFAYNQWTYDTLSGVSWSSYSIAVSDPFAP